MNHGCSSAPIDDNTVFSWMVTYPVKMHEDLSEGKSYVDSLDGKSRKEGQLIGNEGISPLRGCECSGLKHK